MSTPPLVLTNQFGEKSINHVDSGSAGSSEVLQDGESISDTVTKFNFVPDNGVSMDVAQNPDDDAMVNITIGSTVQSGIPAGSSEVSGDADVTFGTGAHNDGGIFQINAKRTVVNNRFRILSVDKDTRDAMNNLQAGDMIYVHDDFHSLYGLQLWDGFDWVVITET